MQGWFYEKGGSETLTIATGNAGKLKEIADLLRPYVSEVRPFEGFDALKVKETGATYADNALIKARAAFEHGGGAGRGAGGFATLGDDSGFEVEVLDGQPGLLSARWAEGKEGAQGEDGEDGGDGTRDFARAIARVQREMRARDCGSSSARFVCALALVRSDGEARVVEGEVRGRVVFPPRGRGGFGYDPIFVPFVGGDACTLGERTFGEMAGEEKQRISHRAEAFRRLCKACFA